MLFALGRFAGFVCGCDGKNLRPLAWRGVAERERLSLPTLRRSRCPCPFRHTCCSSPPLRGEGDQIVVVALDAAAAAVLFLDGQAHELDSLA